jgi:hypothetical protein
LKEYAYNEARYRMLEQSDPATASLLMKQAQQFVDERWDRLTMMAESAPNRSNNQEIPR